MQQVRSAIIPLEDPLKVGATALGERITGLHPSGAEYPTMIIVHGIEDDVVDFGEGEALARQWAAVHKADTLPSRIVREFRGVESVEQRIHSSEGKDVVTFYVFHGLGHKLPVRPGTAPRHGGMETFMSPDVGIHSTYLIAQGFGLLE